MNSVENSIQKLRELLVKCGYNRTHHAAVLLARLRKAVKVSATKTGVSMSNDVVRHYEELRSRLLLDGFDPNSKVMKTVDRLRLSLLEDGFDMTSPDVSPPLSEEAPEHENDSVSQSTTIIKAFRAAHPHDISVLQGVFSSISGWKFRVVHSKTAGPSFVVVHNHPSITPSHVKEAIKTYLSEVGSP